jgi:hypothetical protein
MTTDGKRHKPMAELHRRPTPWRVVEVAQIARESERKIRAAEAVERTSTAPPPPYHPASIAPAAPEGEKNSGEPIARALKRTLLESTARFNLVLSELRAGGISREEAGVVVRTELESLEAASRGGQVPTVAGMLAAIRLVADELSGVAIQTVAPPQPLHVLVIGEDAEARERLAVATEILGHRARSLGGLRELGERAILPAPDALLLSSSLRGAAADSQFSDFVRGLAHAPKARAVVYTAAATPAPCDVARDSGAQSCIRVRADTGVGEIAAQLAPMFDEPWA